MAPVNDVEARPPVLQPTTLGPFQEGAPYGPSYVARLSPNPFCISTDNSISGGSAKSSPSWNLIFHIA